MAGKSYSVCYSKNKHLQCKRAYKMNMHMKEMKVHLRGVSVWWWMSDLTSHLDWTKIGSLYTKITVSRTYYYSTHKHSTAWQKFGFGNSNWVYSYAASILHIRKFNVCSNSCNFGTNLACYVQEWSLSTRDETRHFAAMPNEFIFPQIKSKTIFFKSAIQCSLS